MSTILWIMFWSVMAVVAWAWWPETESAVKAGGRQPQLVSDADITGFMKKAYGEWRAGVLEGLTETARGPAKPEVESP